jgi:cytochrome o ubiquinol oxidase subunit 2
VAKKHRKLTSKYLTIAVVLAFFLALIAYLLHDENVAVLNAKGTIAIQQKQLLITVTLLMLIVVIPVFFMAFWFAYKYRESNKKASYSPKWDSNKLMEFTWWAIPFLIISVIGLMTWQSSHNLDPFKPIVAQNNPITIQVVSLQWKWLFIYPDQQIATLNYINIPRDTPINFVITSDAPMNSFWVPQLGGQIYAMPGMSTQLYLMADEIGSYRGVSANISGEGFAGMNFMVNSKTEVDFYQWVAKTKLSDNSLTFDKYKNLAKPSKNTPPIAYVTSDSQLYDKILMKYMMPMSGSESEYNRHLEVNHGH